MLSNHQFEVIKMERKANLKIIPLGGVGEMGKHMMILEYEDDILIIDAGLAFPDEEMLGIDIVIPDISYLIDNKHKIRGIVLTHGHEDHIGALPYILPQIQVPIYGTRLTLGLVQFKLAENNIKLKEIQFHVVKPKETVKIGVFDVEFIHVNHSIADAVGLGIQTPVGMVIHSGDFKIDQTPVDGEVFDLHTFADLGSKGVLVLISDCANADKSGYTPSERVVGNSLNEIFRTAKGRIILATFASNVHRIQQVIDAAVAHHRKVFIDGVSMTGVIKIALDLGVVTDFQSVLHPYSEANAEIANEEQVILTASSSGEPVSALTRIATGEHPEIRVIPGDTVVLAATPIPGNEKLVSQTVDILYRKGAKVIHDSASGVHVSGHGSREEIKLLLNLVRPQYAIPYHGEYRHSIHYENIAHSVGIPREHVFIAENGDVFEFTDREGIQSGRVQAGKILVDGLGVGDVGNVVLRDRRQLSQDGILIVTMTIDKKMGTLVAGPDILSRGFVYVRESEELMEEAREKVRTVMKKYEGEGTDWGTIKAGVREVLSRHLYEKTRRRPMILPIIMETDLPK